MSIKEFINRQVDRSLNKKVDRILEHYYDDLELSSIFFSYYNGNTNINTLYDEYNPKKGMFNLNTKLTREQTIELAHKFFKSISSELDNYFMSLVNNPNLVHFDKNENNPRSNREQGEAYLTEYGDLRDLYTIVHEISHLFDYRKNNVTGKLLTETNAQCMERLLDLFLLSLSNEELQKYNIDTYILIKDIYNRNIATFFTRLDMIRDININNLRKKAIHSSYMLAEIYSHSFRKLNFDEGKDIIIRLINCIRNDHFDDAIKLFNIDISKFNLNRSNISNELLDCIYNLHSKNNKTKLSTQKVENNDNLSKLKRLKDNLSYLDSDLKTKKINKRR